MNEDNFLDHGVISDFWLKAKLCTCGQPEQAAKALRDHLLYCSSFGKPFEEREKLPGCPYNSGTNMLMHYMLDVWGLTEHGGGVGAAWLTGEGKILLAALCEVFPE